MTNIGDIVQFTFVHTLLGQQIVNVGMWQITDITVDPLNNALFVNAMSEDYIDNVMPLLVSDLQLQEVRYDNLTDGITFAVDSTTANGGTIGAPLPAFNALNIRLNRQTKVTRNGSKRVAGLTEANTEDGICIMTSNELQTIADFWGEPKSLPIDGMVGDDVNMTPVIVGRTPNINGVYEIDLNKVNFVTSATTNNIVTSQVSRK